MCCNCRRPINCYNDKTRYKTMLVLHTFDFIFFIVRLSLVSNDISKKTSDTMSFLVPILLFDLIASVPIIICNIIYITMRHCVTPLIHKEISFERLWHIGTMTCIRLKCHKNRPQAILLMRVIMIVCSFILKFICFIIAAACSARFKSEGTAYTIIAAFALVFSILVIITEFVHFFRLWKYNPTDTRNSNGGNQIHVNNTNETKKIKVHRRHLGFIYYSLLNDENSEGFQHSICKKGADCQSESLHHYLVYHSLIPKRNINSEMSKERIEKPFIAFYQTTKEEALSIAEKGFPYGNDANNTQYKDYLHLKKSIFFTPSCTQNLSSSEAIICVRLNLGRIQKVSDDADIILNKHFGLGDGLCDTIYVENKDRLYIRMPCQIEKWIITINKTVSVNDKLDGPFYEYCL